MSKPRLISALVLVVVILIVIFQNSAPVETRLLFVTITMPRAALLGITMLIGVAIGILVALGMSRKNPPQS
jgi:uncharacterized integral membrane protein